MLDPAAVSAIRYRAEYGESVMNDFVACGTGLEAEGLLLRMFHAMISGEERPELDELARLVRRDPDFFHKALLARDALMADDPKWHGKAEEGGEEYDEYQVLALMARAHIDSGLLYELPIMHLIGIVGRYYDGQDPERETYHKMSAEDMAKIYPR